MFKLVLKTINQNWNQAQEDLETLASCYPESFMCASIVPVGDCQAAFPCDAVITVEHLAHWKGPQVVLNGSAAPGGFGTCETRIPLEQFFSVARVDVLFEMMDDSWAAAVAILQKAGIEFIYMA